MTNDRFKSGGEAADSLGASHRSWRLDVRYAYVLSWGDGEICRWKEFHHVSL